MDQNPQNIARYAAFVRGCPNAHAMQDPDWCRLKAGWKRECVYIEEEGGIIAALTLLIRPMGPFSLAYGPRGPVCDPRDVRLLKRLAAEAQPVLRRHRAFALRIDPLAGWDPEYEAALRQAGFRVRGRGRDLHSLIQARYHMKLPLQPTLEATTAGYSSKTRYNIRLAARKGVAVSFGRTELMLKEFYALYEVTCVRDRMSRRPYAYFSTMAEIFGDRLRVFVARCQGEPLSASVAILYGKSVWYLYGGSANEKRNLMAGYALQQAMIGWAVEAGCAYYDFGGILAPDRSDGLYRFKEGFTGRAGLWELIGEADLVRSPLLYLVFTKAAPALRRLSAKIHRGR
nr:peptidoglycan bridge formation glycyltransferase FemA/FemB family protein [Gehongia tenuis]